MISTSFLCRLAEESRFLDNFSATHIQRLFRGVCMRNSIKHKR